MRGAGRAAVALAACAAAGWFGADGAALQESGEPIGTPVVVERAAWPEVAPVYIAGDGAAIYAMTFDGTSMEPAIGNGEQVLIDASAYAAGVPERGDIVAYFPPFAGATTKPHVKRVVGMPGERVVIRGAAVWIDGEPLGDSWADGRTRCHDHCDVVVPANAVFLLGDNRNNSGDSRLFGPVPLSELVGRVWYAHAAPEGRALAAEPTVR